MDAPDVTSQLISRREQNITLSTHGIFLSLVDLLNMRDQVLLQREKLAATIAPEILHTLVNRRYMPLHFILAGKHSSTVGARWSIVINGVCVPHLVRQEEAKDK